MARGAMTLNSNGDDHAGGGSCAFPGCQLTPLLGTPLCDGHLQIIGARARKANAPRAERVPPLASRTLKRSPFMTTPASTPEAVTAPSKLPQNHSTGSDGSNGVVPTAEPGEGMPASLSGSAADAQEVFSQRPLSSSDDSSFSLSDFMSLDSRSPESANGGRLLLGHDGSSRRVAATATNGLHVEAGKPHVRSDSGLHDKENREEEAAAAAAATGEAETEAAAEVQPRGWWDVEQRRRGRTMDMAFARLPIPSTPLRVSSLYRRDRDRERERVRDSQRDRGERDRSERHRRHLRSGQVPPAQHFSLDAYVYSQDGAVEAPAGVAVPSDAEMAAASAAAAAASPRPSFLYAHIDPRIHWMRHRSASWHEAKQAEIRARGGRKANFGKAVERMVEQRRLELGSRGSSSSAKANSIHGSVHGAPSAPEDDSGWASLRKSASSESVRDRDLPPEVQGNKQWIKFLDLFSQHSEERRKRPSRAG